MEFDALRAAVVPGAAVVGRWPGIVCVAECADRQVLRHLLDVCAAASGPDAGRALARRLTMWLGSADAPGDGLRFGTVAVTGDGRSGGRGEQWAVFLYGPVGLVVPDRQVALSGAQAVSWTDRLLPRPDVPVVLALEGGPIPPGVIDGVHDLRAGVVPGAGAVLVPGGDGGPVADQGEEAARRRPDEPSWAEPTERERPRWGGTPEPALALPPDGLLRGGDGPANGLPTRGAFDDFSPGLPPDPGADLGPGFGGDPGDRPRLGERGRAHLRPVPSGSNGVGHRGRGPRRASALDLSRFGLGPARNREFGGEERGSGTTGPPGDEPDAPGPRGGEPYEQPEDQPTDHHAVPRPAEHDTPAAPDVAADPTGVIDMGTSDTVRAERVRDSRAGLDADAVPDDLSGLDSPFRDAGRDAPQRGGSDLDGNPRAGLGGDFDGAAHDSAHDGAHDGGSVHNGTTLNGATHNGSRNGSFESTFDGTDAVNSSGGHNGHPLARRGGRPDGAESDREPWPGAGAERREAPWALAPDPDDGTDRGADVHWFATRDQNATAESGQAPDTADDRRPRHGRQDGAPDEDDDPAAGTPRFGLSAVGPEEMTPEAVGSEPSTAPSAGPPVSQSGARSGTESTAQTAAKAMDTIPPIAAVPAPSPPVEPDQPPTAPAPLRAEAVLGVPAGDARPPLEAGRPAGVDEDAAADTVDDSHVRGHLCPRGHLNDPRVGTCAFCGSRIEDTGDLVAGPRPPLGLLVFDDGATYTVDAEYLVGRMPEGDSRVTSGVLRSLSVEDPSGAVSRVHAEVRVTGWDVVLADAGSRNGTFVSGPGDPEWVQLPAGQTHRLQPGTRVRLGGRSFLFESPSGAH